MLRRVLIVGLVAGAVPVAAVVATPGDSACCTKAGCVDVSNETECNVLGGFFLPSERCDEDACGVGACCFGEACVETDAFTCFFGGRDFAGAGTRCDEDPCDIGVGACCVSGVCETVEEPACDGLGGTFLGVGTLCVNEPCTLGACCLDAGCQDGARYECDDLGGEFAPGMQCSKMPCGIASCPDGSLFAQPPDDPESFEGAFTSETAAGLQRFEDYTGVGGPIESVTWWGLDLRHIGGGQFEECVESDPTFEVSFHADAGGVPGAAVCFAKVTAQRTPLGIFYLGFELNEYAVTLPEPCVLVNGWVSVIGQGDPQCWFLWMSAGAAGTSYCDGCLVPVEGVDLAVCIGGTVGGVLGACCDEKTGVCLDDVDIADCADPGQRFAPDKACDALDPPCGVILGACCLGGDACEVETEKDCAGAGGEWLGPNTPCLLCPCSVLCPPDATIENETRCFDDYVDTFNGGCNAGTPAFLPIALGETVCGEGGIFLAGGEPTPDYDWYAVEITKAGIMTWSVLAEFRPRLWIYDGNKGCPADLILTSAGAECAPTGIAAFVDPGTYYVVVSAGTFNDSSQCGARYTATLGPAPECPEDLDGSGAVDFGDILDILAAWGPCPPDPGCPQDLDGSGTVDFGDILAVLAAWGPC